MNNYPKYTCNLNNTDCLGFKQGECRSIENCTGKTEIILSEQKEPCHKQVKCKYGETGCGDCEYTHSLNRPLTIGDKIRESNESMADFIKRQFGDDRVFINGDEYDIEDYLNQPYGTVN